MLIISSVCSRDPELLLHAAGFTTGYVRLVGQEPAPSKCVLLSTSREVRHSMKGWVFSQEGDQWSVRFECTGFGWAFRHHLSGLVVHSGCSEFAWFISRLVLIFALPLDFHGRVRVVQVHVSSCRTSWY